jgi:hypothetical protein
MATTTGDAAALKTLSAAQQRESLWGDAQQRVYAVIVTAKVPGLRERLAHGDVDDWDGVWTGELDAQERAAAPVLVTLKRESAFTDWLLREAAASFADWGLIALSRLPFLAMRTHARALCKGQLPNGQAIRIDWMDPAVMAALLPVATPDQLQRAYAGFDALVTLSPTRWVRWTLEGARLLRQASGVA